MNKNTFSYKLGFKKGIEIYNQNSLKGYFADEDNQKLIKRCKYYADTGYKNNLPLKQTQIDFYLGMYDGIRYQYKKHGTPIPEIRTSKFEEHVNNHYYGKEKHYYGFGYYD